MEGPKVYQSLVKTMIISFHSIVLLSSFVFSFGGITQQRINIVITFSFIIANTQNLQTENSVAYEYSSNFGGLTLKSYIQLSQYFI